MTESVFATVHAYTRQMDSTPAHGTGEEDERVADASGASFRDFLHWVAPRHDLSPSSRMSGGLVVPNASQEGGRETLVAALTESPPNRQIGDAYKGERVAQLYSSGNVRSENGPGAWTVIAPASTPRVERSEVAASMGFRIYARSQDGEAEWAKEAQLSGKQRVRVDIRR